MNKKYTNNVYDFIIRIGVAIVFIEWTCSVKWWLERGGGGFQWISRTDGQEEQLKRTKCICLAITERGWARIWGENGAPKAPLEKSEGIRSIFDKFRSYVMGFLGCKSIHLIFTLLIKLFYFKRLTLGIKFHF